MIYPKLQLSPELTLIADKHDPAVDERLKKKAN